MVESILRKAFTKPGLFTRLGSDHLAGRAERSSNPVKTTVGENAELGLRVMIGAYRYSNGPLLRHRGSCIRSV